jgi:hypothetical protein
MRLPLRPPAQDPKYARYWNQQHQLDYWIFGLLLLVVLAILYCLFALSHSDSLWLDRLTSVTQNVRVVAAGGIPRVWPPRGLGELVPLHHKTYLQEDAPSCSQPRTHQMGDVSTPSASSTSS